MNVTAYGPVEVDGGGDRPNDPLGKSRSVVPRRSNKCIPVMIAFALGFASGAAVCLVAIGRLRPSSAVDDDAKAPPDDAAIRSSSSPSSRPYGGSSLSSPSAPPAGAPVVPRSSNWPSHQGGASPPPTKPPADTEMSERNRLYPVNDTAFLDHHCIGTRSYRSILPPASPPTPLLLWAHVYSPGNAPAAPTVGPFDDPPERLPNTGRVTIRGAGPSSPVTLLLVAYAAVNWTVDVVSSETTNLVRVLGAGYRNQFVTIVNNATEVEIEYYDFADRHTGPLPGTSDVYPSGAFGSLKDYKDALEAYVGAPLYQYDYCYYGSQLEYRLDGS